MKEYALKLTCQQTGGTYYYAGKNNNGIIEVCRGLWGAATFLNKRSLCQIKKNIQLSMYNCEIIQIDI